MLIINILKTLLIYYLIGIGGLISLYTLNYDGDITYLGGGYEYAPEHDHILGPVEIPPCVINYNFNKQYIIVQQNPQGHMPDAIYDTMEYKYPMGPDSIYYWIIDKTNHNYYGPILYHDFLEKCQEMGVDLVFDKQKELSRNNTNYQLKSPLTKSSDYYCYNTFSDK